MRRYRTQGWLLSGALGAAWLLSGQDAHAQSGTSTPPRPAAARPSLSFAGSDAPQKVTISSGGQVIEVTVKDHAGNPVTPTAAATQTAPRVVNATPQPLPPLTPMQIPPRPQPPVSASEPAARSTFPRAEPEPRRRAYIDLTAAACFAHAPDYTWLIGQVEYSSIAKQWRLRYASVDEFDRYGGHVTLIDDQHVRELADGKYVQVHGHVVNPNSTGMEPTYYRIESLQPVSNPNTVQAPASPR